MALSSCFLLLAADPSLGCHSLQSNLSWLSLFDNASLDGVPCAFPLNSTCPGVDSMGAQDGLLGSGTRGVPRRAPPLSVNYSSTSMVVVSLVLVLMVLATAFGNFLVGLALFRYRSLRTVSNLLIGNLALSDFLLATTILPLSTVNECLGRWVFGRAMCNLWLSLDVLYCTASIWNLCMIAFDRYTATLYPLWYREKRSAAQAALYVSLVWVIALAICVPPVLGWGEPTQNYVYNERTDVHQCVLYQSPGYVLYSACGSFYIPFLVTFFMYVRIFVLLRARMRRMRKARAISRSAAIRSRRHGHADLPAIPPGGLLAVGAEGAGGAWMGELRLGARRADLCVEMYLLHEGSERRVGAGAGVGAEKEAAGTGLLWGALDGVARLGSSSGQESEGRSTVRARPGSSSGQNSDSRSTAQARLGDSSGQESKGRSTIQDERATRKPDPASSRTTASVCPAACNIATTNSSHEVLPACINNLEHFDGKEAAGMPERDFIVALSACVGTREWCATPRRDGLMRASCSCSSFLSCRGAKPWSKMQLRSSYCLLNPASEGIIDDANSREQHHGAAYQSATACSVVPLGTARPADRRAVAPRTNQDALTRDLTTEQDTPGWHHNTDQDASGWHHSTDQDAPTRPHSADQDAPTRHHSMDQDAPTRHHSSADPSVSTSRLEPLSTTTIENHLTLPAPTHPGTISLVDSRSPRPAASCGLAVTPEGRAASLGLDACLHRRFDQRELRATVRMAIIISLFCVMWVGFFVVYVVRGWCPAASCRVPRELEAFFFWLGYSNSSVNPVLYSLFNDDFRRAFHKILCLRADRDRPVWAKRRTL